jgi:Molybdopterin converting factor, large subunit
VRESELSVDEVRAAVADPAGGGIALFAGTVRDSDHARGVSGLSYSAHPSALDELRRVAEVIAEKYPVIGIAAVHRVGTWPSVTWPWSSPCPARTGPRRSTPAGT